MNIGLYISPAHAVPPLENNILAPWVLVKHLADGLVDLGHTVTLFAAKGSKTKATLVHGGISPTVNRREDYRDSDLYRAYVTAQELALMREVIRLSKAGKLDLVHIHQPIERLYPTLLAMPARIPVAITFHDPITPKRFPALEKLVGLGNIHFVSLSASQQQGVPFPFAGIVPNGIDTKLFRPDSMGTYVGTERHAFSSSAMRKNYSGGPVGGFPPRTPTRGPLLGGPPTPATPTSTLGGDAENAVPTSAPSRADSRPLLITGRIVPQKGFTDAIAIARQVGVRLLIVGKEYERNKIAKEYFETEIRPAIDGKHVLWESVVSQEHLIGHYQTARALLFPIHWEEPFGLVMIEAMACGTPVIAFNSGSVPEIVRDGVTGFIIEEQPFQADTPWQIQKTGTEGMAEAVRRIDTIDRAACRRHVERHFTLSHMTNAYEKVYTRLISG